MEDIPVLSPGDLLLTQGPKLFLPITNCYFIGTFALTVERVRSGEISVAKIANAQVSHYVHNDYSICRALL